MRCCVGETIELLETAKEGLSKGALDIGSGVLEKMGCFDRKINGSGTVTAVAAIYMTSKYASNPHQGLLEAAYLKNADTDTLALNAGRVIGYVAWNRVFYTLCPEIDCSRLRIYLKKLTHLEPKNNELNNIRDVLDYNNSVFNSKIKQLKPGDTLFALPFNTLTVKEKRPNKSYASGSIIHTIKLVSEEGQSIFIKTFEKAPETKQPQGNIIGQQTLGLDKKPNIKEQPYNNKKTTKPVLDANKIRSLANLLPENMPSAQCFFFISDVLAEIERSAFGKIDGEGFNVLINRWNKYYVSKEHIDRVQRVILY